MEVISANNNLGVYIGGSAVGGMLDFSTVTLDNITRIDGTDGNDTITASSLDSVRVEGGAGDDLLNGGVLDDTLIGGDGHDLLRGDPGSDVFRFSTDTECGIGANALAAGNQAFSFLGTGNFTNTAGQLRCSSSGDGYTRLSADQNGDGLADFEIALTGTLSLTSASFLLRGKFRAKGEAVSAEPLAHTVGGRLGAYRPVGRFPVGAGCIRPSWATAGQSRAPTPRRLKTGFSTRPALALFPQRLSRAPPSGSGRCRPLEAPFRTVCLFG